MSKIKVSIQCACGSTTFDIPPNPGPQDTVRCLKCGASGSFGEVLEQARAQAAEAVRSQTLRAPAKPDRR